MFIMRLLRNFLRPLIDKSKGQFIRRAGVRASPVLCFCDANYFSSGGVRSAPLLAMFAQARPDQGKCSLPGHICH